MRVKAIFGILGAALVLSVVAGCESYDNFEICKMTNPPDGATVNENGVSITQGQAVAIKIIPWATDGDIMDEDTPVTITVDDEMVLGVDRVDPEHDSCDGPMDANWHFALYGVSSGQTTAYVRVDGRIRAEIPVDVFSP